MCMYTESPGPTQRPRGAEGPAGGHSETGGGWDTGWGSSSKAHTVTNMYMLRLLCLNFAHSKAVIETYENCWYADVDI